MTTRAPRLIQPDRTATMDPVRWAEFIPVLRAALRVGGYGSDHAVYLHTAHLHTAHLHTAHLVNHETCCITFDHPGAAGYSVSIGGEAFAVTEAQWRELVEVIGTWLVGARMR